MWRLPGTYPWSSGIVGVVSCRALAGPTGSCKLDQSCMVSRAARTGDFLVGFQLHFAAIGSV